MLYPAELRGQANGTLANFALQLNHIAADLAPHLAPHHLNFPKWA